MFDPESVTQYGLFCGDAVNVLLDFKPKSVHSCFATPGVWRHNSEKYEPWEDFFGYRAQLCQLLYETVRDDGSCFMAMYSADVRVKGRLEDMMESIGWIGQHDTGFSHGGHTMHWTKSDNFYESHDIEPLVLREDFETFMNVTTQSLELGIAKCTPEHRATDKLDRICSVYTPPGGITLEPTVGYGNHVVAALQRGRRAVGIDRDRMCISVCARRAAMLLDFGNLDQA